jgi:hypothetical protein
VSDRSDACLRQTVSVVSRADVFNGIAGVLFIGVVLGTFNKAIAIQMNVCSSNRYQQQIVFSVLRHRHQIHDRPLRSVVRRLTRMSIPTSLNGICQPLHDAEYDVLVQ